jgi:hypothetical protein
LDGSAATFQHSVGPFWLRQIMDITYSSYGCVPATTCARPCPGGILPHEF